MKSFKHVNAKTIKEAVKSLKDYEGRAKLNAGGTDLLGILKDKILPDYPETIINIKTIPNLDYISEDNTGLKIGTLAKLEDIAQSPIIKSKYKLLAEAAGVVATPQVRRMGTIGGNLCQDVRCWYYRYPHHAGGRIPCYLKGGKGCYALTRENQYHSIFGGLRGENTPCSSACPGSVDIPSYMDEIREGNLDKAAKILLDGNPIPSITGRVCPHFCEQACNREEFDESVSIRDIERFIGDYILEHADELLPSPETDTGKSVAVIGSGPAGLSAAYYLRMSGHSVTVFDRREEAGGMLAYVIPAYRLPKDIVRRVVMAIENTGVKFRLNFDIGNDLTLDDLRRDFDSVFIATGAWDPVSIGLDGEESTRFGTEFLANINLGIKEIPGNKVLVIGGGNAAIDVAVSALRLGAEKATIACLESREEMPALPWEIEQAVEEGVELMPSWGPLKVLKSDGKVEGMELVRCTSVFDEQGHFAPAYDNTVKETVKADQIMMAVGYATDLGFIPKGSLKIDKDMIIADPKTQATNMPGVFAGGTVVHGPATVIEAIAAGKRAASAMDRYLGEGMKKTENKKTIKPLLKFNSDYIIRTKKTESPKLPVAKRSIEIEDSLGLKLSDMEAEANRCFNCGCVSVNPSDIGVVLLALDAKLRIAGLKGIRTVPIDDFFGSLGNILEADEMITEVQVAQPPDNARQVFLKFRMRKSVDFPIVSVASIVAQDKDICKEARIALGAVAPRPIRAIEAEQTIKGKVINSETADAAGEAAIINAITLSKNAYKLEITKTLVKRALLSWDPPRNALTI